MQKENLSAFATDCLGITATVIDKPSLYLFVCMSVHYASHQPHNSLSKIIQIVLCSLHVIATTIIAEAACHRTAIFPHTWQCEQVVR